MATGAQRSIGVGERPSADRSRWCAGLLPDRRGSRPRRRRGRVGVDGGLRRGRGGSDPGRVRPLGHQRGALRVDHAPATGTSPTPPPRQGDTLSLSLFNPTDTVAVVDVSFVSSATGVLAPPAYQGIDVPGLPRGGERRRPSSRTTLTWPPWCRRCRGRWWRPNSSRPGPPGGGGASVVLGSAPASPTWTFAQNTDVTGAAPSSTSSTRRAAIGPGDGEDRAAAGNGRAACHLGSRRRRWPASMPRRVTRIPANDALRGDLRLQPGESASSSTVMCRRRPVPPPRRRGTQPGCPAGATGGCCPPKARRRRACRPWPSWI